VLVGGGSVEQPQDVVYGGGEDSGGVDGAEKLGRAGMVEVVDLQAELGLGECLVPSL
jgi:hypothetical protein